MRTLLHGLRRRAVAAQLAATPVPAPTGARTKRRHDDGPTRIGVRPPTLVLLLSYDRYCAEIIAQTDQLRSHIEGADLTVPVPSCPGWNLGQLLRRLGGGHRWVERPLGVLLAWRPAPGHWPRTP